LKLQADEIAGEPIQLSIYPWGTPLQPDRIANGTAYEDGIRVALRRSVSPHWMSLIHGVSAFDRLRKASHVLQERNVRIEFQ